jgi:hypothetical protein
MERMQILREYVLKLEQVLDHPHTIDEWAGLLAKAFPRSYRQPPLGERTLLPPGARVEVYAARRAAGLAVFHPDDDYLQLEDF